MAATVSAELVLAPIAAAVFGRVTLAGLLLNLIGIPAMAVVEIAGLVVVVLGSVWPGLGHLCALAASMAANLLLSSGALVDWWPWLSWRVPSVSMIWILLYYATAALLVFVPLPKLRRRVTLVAAAAALIVTLWAPGLQRHRPAAGHLRISLIDVGQGDAILVQSPFGQALLVDAGGGPGSYDIGTRVVTPAVWAMGDRALTWLAVTHGDRDHAGGAVGVADDLDPREIWEGVPVQSAPDMARLRQLASARGIIWRSIRAGAHLTIGAIEIEALHPLEPEWERPRVRNDDSLVLRIRYGRVDAILTGDAGAEFERRLPADLGASPIRILKAGHHGSRTSTSDLLIRAMRPQVALISVGRGNLFGHPSPEVIGRLEAAGAEVFRTDRDGAISVETDGATVWILTALGRRLTVVSTPPL
jgi:competence protein ComEC